MILDTTTRKLQILLGATVAANQLRVTVDYVEFTSSTTTPALQLSTTNNTTAVDILDAPASSTQRKVNFISIANRDTDFVNVTVRLNDNGTTYNYVSSMALAPNCTLQFTDTRGWSIIDSNGNILIAPTAVTNIQVFTANGTWTAPKGSTYTLVDCFGGGGSGAGGTGNLIDLARAGGGAGGGGVHMQMQFLTAELTPFVGVTVAASKPGGTGGSTAAGTIGGRGFDSLFGNFLVAYGGGGGGVNSTTGGGGGGGAGGGGVGPSATTGTGTSGGNCATLNVAAGVSSPDYRGGGGAASTANGGSSYLGGGGGGGGGAAGNAQEGGSSYFSGGGGGGGGGISAGVANTAYAGGRGGLTGGAATTAGGGATPATINTGAASANGADGDSTKAGGGGAGGSANNAGTGSKGGDGGFPSGGGGGGGAGTATGGAGGAGGAGKVVVISW